MVANPSVVVVLLLLTLTCSPVVPYQHFQLEIPNGELVPHPCKANFLWRAVGHENHLGGGARNSFGKDFQNNNFKWTIELCKLDSDGDGMTNGQELGDPDCVWTKGAKPKTSLNLTHPGVCQPFEKCGGKPVYVDCDHVEFECDVLQDPDVFNFTVRMPDTPVPAQETTYTCMHFEFPVNMTSEYHIVADKPFIDNADVMHHILVFGCRGNITTPINKPYTCGMNAGQECNDIIGIWAVGISGECFNRNSGFKIGGTKGYTHGAFQYHWNNPAKIPNHKDSSGMTFYVTSKLRPFNAGVFMIGSMMLTIPPGKSRHIEKGGCTSECTNDFIKKEIKITSVFNHMHYLGIAQETMLHRKAKTIIPLGIDKSYSYDSPKIHLYQTGITVLPGDELLTTCTYKSTSRSEVTYYGDGTQQEMCYSFLTYYPKEAISQQSCLTFGDFTTCDWTDDGIIAGCKTWENWNVNHPETAAVLSNVSEKCSPSTCRSECREYAREVKQMPCYKGPYDKYIRYEAASENNEKTLKFYAALDSCDVEDTSSAFTRTPSLLMMILMATSGFGVQM